MLWLCLSVRDHREQSQPYDTLGGKRRTRGSPSFFPDLQHSLRSSITCLLLAYLERSLQVTACINFPKGLSGPPPFAHRSRHLSCGCVEEGKLGQSANEARSRK